MATTTYTATLANGITATRKSANGYGWVVVGTATERTVAHAQAELAEHQDSAPSVRDYYAQVAQLTTVGLQHVARWSRTAELASKAMNTALAGKGELAYLLSRGYIVTIQPVD